MAALPDFAPEDLLQERQITAVHACPAHDLAVCAVRTIDADNDCYRSSLWLVPLDGRPPRELTHGSHDDGSPCWSPDGERIAFLSARGEDPNPQIQLMEAAGGEAWALSRFTQGVNRIEWSPDGSSLLAVCPQPVDPERRGERGDPPQHSDPNAPQLAWRLPYKMDGSGYLLNQEQHLFVIGIDGQSRQLSDGPFDVQSACWSPDGRQIAYSRTRTGRLAHRTDIWCVDTGSGEHRQLSVDQPSATSPAWSPDGRWIAFLGASEDGDSQYRPWLIDTRDGEVRALGSVDLEVGSGETLHWLPDASGLAVIMAERGLQVLKMLAVPGGEARLLHGGERQLSLLGRSARHWVYASESADAPMELMAARRDGATSEARLTCFNSAWQDRAAPRVSLRSFEVPDGRGGTERIEGWLLQPPDDSAQGSVKPAPLLVDAHGGPSSYALLNWGTHAYWQVLCSRGWRVLALNPVGSSSYGKEFSERLNGRWGELDLPQHLAAIQQLQREGLADDRLAIAGKSYGGYLSAWAIGQHTGFRAAVVSAPVTNLESHYGTSDSGFHADPYSMNGTPYEDRRKNQLLSPMKHVQKACTPTLIMQGEQDQRCPRCQSEELFVSLMTLTTVPAELVMYPGGSHHLFERGRPSHRVDTVRRLCEWVERWVDEPRQDHARKR